MRTPRALLHLASATLAAGSVAMAAGACGTGAAPDPFGFDAGLPPEAAGSGGAGGTGTVDGGPEPDPTLGGPCIDDGQCDDEVDCTFDRCDLELERCRFTPDDGSCQNTGYCDGVERCDQKLGCRPGEPVSCTDDTPCTIDECDEATHVCSHAPRDADLDGDPDGHCPDGGDCDDADPTISSLVAEVCGNTRDDDCDGTADEVDCTQPLHDTCLDPLEIGVAGSYAMSTAAAAFHYPSSCGLPNQQALRDVVAAIIVPAGPPVDVEITARAAADVAVTLAGQCGDAATEITCGLPFPSPQGGKLAKLRGRALGSPDQPIAYPLYVTTDQAAAVTLDVQYLPVQPAPTHETCGTAIPLTAGTPTTAAVLGAALDLTSACPSATGDLVYSFTLASPQDIDLYATSIDGDGVPAISLRDVECALPEDEIACHTHANAHIFRHALPAGTYHVRVAATAPTDVSLTLELSAPTAPPADDDCSGTVALEHGVTIDVPLADHQDDVNLGCFPGAVDAAYVLTLTEASDVLLVERISGGDSGAIELSLAACAGPADLLACGSGAPSPVRAAEHDVPAGEYRVVAESAQGQPVQVTAFVRPAVAPVLVPFADGCADAFEIPASGGLFQGNTANVAADFDAGCDQGGVPQGGAKDQLLKLTLASPKRVVLDMAGSAYNTVLDVRVGPGCPGVEVLQGCAVGFPPGRSFLDLDLAAGTYFIQIDGHALGSGPWFLDVHVSDP